MSWETGVPHNLIQGDDLRVALVSGDRAVQVDFTGAVAVIDHGHSMIHRKAAFNLTGLIELPGSGTVWLLGQGTGVHWTGGVFNASEGGFQVEFREGVVATGGTAITPISRNRRPALPVSAFAVKQGVTVTGEGALLSTFGFPPAATQQTRVAVSGADNREWILDPALIYGIAFKNNTNAAKEIYVDFEWYEPSLLS